MRRGQALVLVLLVLAVGLTTGLAVVSRSVTDIATTTTQEESSRSLSAAEAGVEAALSGGSLPTQVGTSNVTVSSSAVGGSSVDSPEALIAGESATFYLSKYTPADGTISSEYNSTSLFLCWEDAGGTRPAIEATVYYKDVSDIKVKRWAIDPDSENGFSAPNANINDCPTGRTYGFAANLTGIPSGKIMLRTRLFYNGDTGAFVAIKSSGASIFPDQGKDVTSSGESGDTTRKLSVESRDPDMSPLLDTAVFSGVDLSK